MFDEEHRFVCTDIGRFGNEFINVRFFFFFLNEARNPFEKPGLKALMDQIGRKGRALTKLKLKLYKFLL